jgi:transcriptional regulator with XRE-family HTH domain
MKRILLASAMRGLYRRVANKLGVDPSYVSRVARGERRSAKIAAELNREISKILSSMKKSQRTR